MAVNKELKHRVLNEYPELVYKMVSLSRLDYAKWVLRDSEYTDAAIITVLGIDEKEYVELCQIEDEVNLLWFAVPDVVDEARRIAHAYNARKQRLKKRIQKMFNSGYDCYFLTLTFNDEALMLKPTVRRKYVARYLASVGFDYVANIDFGEEYSREHYHAVVQWNGADFCPFDMVWKGKTYSSWGYGFLGVEKCQLSLVDITKLAKYTAKLTNHAFKESASGSSMIYARCTIK